MMKTSNFKVDNVLNAVINPNDIIVVDLISQH